MSGSSVDGRFVAMLALASLTSCGPGPLPPENPAESLSSPPEPVPVQVETTAKEEPAPVLTPALTEAPTPAVEPPVVAPAERGFLTPESVLYDAANDKYLVSNINGGPSDADNNGFIAIVNPDGSVHQLDFIAGGKKGATLNAPKGLALHGGTLYVADITVVRKFDAKTGAARGVIQFPKSTFINDITVDADGTLYVSDTGIKIAGNDVTPTGTDALYKVTKGKVSVFAKGEHLNRPNGVALVNGNLVTVTFGNKQLLQFDAKGNVASTTELPASTLDGVLALPNGQLLVSSWEKQSVYIGSVGGTWSVANDNVPSPADIGFDPTRARVLVPVFLGNELRFVHLAVPGAATAPAATSPAAVPAAPPHKDLGAKPAAPAPAASPASASSSVAAATTPAPVASAVQAAPSPAASAPAGTTPAAAGTTQKPAAAAAPAAPVGKPK